MKRIFFACAIATASLAVAASGFTGSVKSSSNTYAAKDTLPKDTSKKRDTMFAVLDTTPKKKDTTAMALLVDTTPKKKDTTMFAFAADTTKPKKDTSLFALLGDTTTPKKKDSTVLAMR